MYNVTASTTVSKLTSDRKPEVFSEETSLLLTWSTPTWEKELQDIAVDERQRGVELICICKGLAHPSAKWFHKGREVFSDFHMKLRQVAETASLTIKEIREQDNGTFKCVMTGDNGQIDTSCVLTVKAPEIVLPPVFVKELHDVEVEEGEQLELGVEVMGTPPVGVFWFHNNMEITRDNPNFLMASLGHVHTLSLLRATAKYSGEYVCEAYNDFGDTDTFCFVEVREDEQLDPPGFVSPPSAVTAKEGETVTFTCQVKGQPSPTVLWERGGAIIAINQKYKMTKIQERHSLTIYNVSEADAGEYVCLLHSSGRELSHTCSLYVVSDLHATKPQPSEVVKSRLVYIKDLPETDQSERKNTFQQVVPSSLEMSSSFQHNNPRDTDNPSEHAAVNTTRETFKTSCESKIGALSKIYTHRSAKPQSHADDHESRCQLQDQHDDDHLCDSTSSEKLNISSLQVSKNICLKKSTKQQIAPESKHDYHSVLSKTHRKVEDKNATINTGATDFRGILKHRTNSPSHQTTKFVEQRDLTGNLQKSSFHDKVQQSNFQNENSKEDKLVYKLINIPAGQTPSADPSQGAEFTSLSHSTSPDLSSKEVHNSNQPQRNKSSKQIYAGVERELTSIPKKSGNLKYFGLSSETNSVPSLVVRQAVGSRETPASSKGVGNVISEQKLYISAAPVEVDQESRSMVTSGELIDVPSACFIGNKLSDSIEEQKKSGSVDSPRCEHLFVSEIQIADPRTCGNTDHATSITSTHAEHNFKVSLNTTPLPEIKSHARTKGSFSEILNVVSEAKKPEASPPYNVSIVHIYPEVPLSSPKPDEIKLEVTSVSMSIPLRSSTSSPRSHSSSNSVSVPGCFPHQTSDCTTVGYEDTDNVFADANDDKKAAHPGQSSSGSEYKATSHAYGPIFTWEKAPWDTQKIVQDDSTFHMPDVTNMTEIENKHSSLSEKDQCNVSSHQWETNVTFAPSVNSKVRSVSDCDLLPAYESSQSSAQAVRSAANDFRTLRLKPAASKVRSDLFKSKFLSASTECVFADVKLKSVSKMNDRWRKSHASLDTEGFKDVPKSTDSVRGSSKDLPQQSRWTQDTVKTKVKVSENLKTPVNNAKSQNRYENVKPVNKSKIKTVAATYEKSPQFIPPRTKSKGIGAKFEASIKDSQASNRHLFSNVPNPVKKNMSEINTSKSTASYDMKSGTVSDKIQHWRVTEMKMIGNSDKKMLGSIGKSNSYSDIMESGRDLHPDEIPDFAKQKRHSLQTDTISASQSNAAPTEFVVPIKDAFRTSQVPEGVKVDVNETSHIHTSQTAHLNQTGTPTLKSDSVSGNSLQKAGFSTVKANVLDGQNVKHTATRKLKVDTSENKNVNVNRVDLSSRHKGGSPRAVQNKQDAKPEWINRKPLNNIETKVKANTGDKNQQTKTRSEWVNTKSSKQSHQTEFTKGNKNMTEFEVSTGVRNMRKDEQNSFVHVRSKNSGTGCVESRETNIASLDSRQKIARNELNEEDKAGVFEKSAVSKSTINTAVTDIKTAENAVFLQMETLVTNIKPAVVFLDSPPTTSNILASSEKASSAKASSAKASSAVAIVAGRESETARSGHNQYPAGAGRESETARSGHIQYPAGAGRELDTARSGHIQYPAGAGRESETARSGHNQYPAGAGRESETARSGHNQYPAGAAHPVSVAKDIELSTTFRRSSITQDPLEEIRASEISVDPDTTQSSTITRKDYLVDNTSKHMQADMELPSEDHLSHIRNSKSSLVRHKHPKSVPIHQSQDIGLVPYQEQLRSSMDDSESLLSTTSISSSSSDASNVTVDSGYPRSSSRKFLDNDRIELQSKNAYPQQSTTSITVAHPGKHDKEVRGTADSFQMKKNIFEVADNKKNLGSQFKLGGSDRGIHILASNLKHTTGAREKFTHEATAAASEEMSGLGTTEGPQLTSDSRAVGGLEQVGRHGRQFVNAVVTAQEAPKDDKFTDVKNTEDCKNAEKLTNDKDAEDVADLTNDFGTTRKYSKKRRKHLQINVNEGIIITSPDTEKPASKFVEEFKTHETETRMITVESNVTVKPEESTDKSNIKETRPKFDTEGASHRRWELRKNLKEDKDDIKKTKSHDTKSSISRPTDLDLTARWRSRKPIAKPGTEVKDVKSTFQGQVTSGKLTASVGRDTVTAVTAAQALEPQPPPCPPSFPIPLRDTKVILGSTTVLHCQVIGDPRPEVKWLLNHTQLEPSGNIEIVYSKDIAQLTVKETFTEHVGDYSCWAKNVLGTVSTHCTLSLEASNKTESRAFEGPVFVPPKIVSFAPSSLTLVRGSSLSLSVTFTGEPRPTVSWMRGDKELSSDNHVQIVTDANSSCLTIESATRSDAGKMSACLTSTTGTDQASTNIYIEDVPGSPVGRPHVYEIDRNSASLSWCGPTYNEECQVTHYIIEARTSQDQAWEVIVPHCTDQSCHIPDLKTCSTYQFRVLAVNKHGLSAPSEPSEDVFTTDPYNTSPSDYESEDDLPFEPREVKINTSEQFEDVYELHKEVGKGKFGVVYKCEHKREGTIWAAKMVKCREKDKNVIRREIEIMNKLRHPKLLLLWDAYEAPRQMVLVTEYVGAGELFERVIGEDFVLTECDCIHFLRQICEGVNYMHGNNILHLDLKPENILCIAENSNRIKIIDFGLAQFHQPGQSNKVLFGTPEFIAPEVINYDEIGFATDMWSIGVICYVLLSGLSPFLGDNDAETLASVTIGEYDFDDEAFDEISNEAKDFISKLLVKKKENRLLTEQCLSHVWLAQHETSSVRRRRLNTERLKRFMVRRKWLKTGNAVLAVSRLLKSSNLGSLSSLNNIGCGSNNVQNQSAPEMTVRNQPLLNSTRHSSPEEFNTAANVDQLSNVSIEDIPDNCTDQNDNQIHTAHLVASGSDDNHNNQSAAECIDSMSTAVSCSQSAIEIGTDIKTVAEQGSKDDGESLQAAPVFVKSMLDTDACVGDVARFDVAVAGSPLPVVTWCFEGEDIRSDSRHTVDMNETTRSFSLIIRSIVEEDEGEYICKAVNSHGKAVCVAELSVFDI